MLIKKILHTLIDKEEELAFARSYNSIIFNIIVRNDRIIGRIIHYYKSNVKREFFLEEKDNINEEDLKAINEYIKNLN